MSGTVDSRIVSMKFDNGDFGSKITKTLGLLDKLRASVSFPNAGKGLEQLQAKTNSFSTANMSNSIEGVSKKFLALSTIGVTALATITSKAANAAGSIVNSFSFGPISDGFHQYEQQINATQTILANTSASGATLKDVTNTLAVLNDYANKTIYNFSDMATNLGTFTSAGIKLKPAAESIQGLSNVAAAAGATTQQAASAMYQLSQGLGRGKIIAQDWMSVVSNGMASASFKNALLETAKAMGTIKMPKTESIDQWVKKGGSFQDAMSKGQITSAVMITTLQAMTGNMTDAQLAQKGYTAEQIKSVQAMAKQAKAAAVNVKTFSALKDNLKQGVGSSWAQVFKTVFGDLPTATKNMTKLSGILNEIFVTPVDRLNAFLKGWAKLGGLKLALDGIKNVFKAIAAVIQPIKSAFRDIFPPKTAKDLLILSRNFDNFTKRLIIGKDTADKLRRTFAGVFAVFSIAKEVVHAVAIQIGRLFHAVSGNSGSFLDLTARVGDFLVKINNLIKDGDSINTFFYRITDSLKAPAELLRKVGKAIGDLFSGFDFGSAQTVTDSFDRIRLVVKPMQTAGEAIHKVFDGIGNVFHRVGDMVSAGLAKMGELIKNSFGPGSFKGILSAINTGLFAALVLSIRKFLSGGVKVNVGGGLFDKIKGTLDGVNKSLAAMQQNLKANILLKIAGAIALLAASIYVISTINDKDLGKALVTITVGFIAMQTALVSMSKAIGVMGTAKLPLITGSLVAMAGAMVVLATALKILASISPEDTGRSLLNMASMLFIATKAMKSLAAGSVGMVLGATALVILANALIVMAGALKLLSLLSWQDMAHGMAAMAGGLVIMAAALKLMPKGIIQQAIAIGILAGAMSLMAGALKLMSMLSWDQMARGMVGIAGALAIIIAAMRLMPRNIVAQAVGIGIVAVAMNAIAGAMKIMGSMGWEAIGKGLVVLGGAMLILVVGLNAMEGALPGAAALLVAAGALAVLTPVLIALGAMSWTMIIKSMVALAGTFLILGVASLVLAAVVPVILALGAAMVLIGAGFALAGAGAFLFATAFGIVVAAGVAGVMILTKIIGTIISSIPTFLKAVGVGLVALAEAIGAGAPVIFSAIQALLIGFLDTVIRVAPKVGEAFLTLITTGLRVIVAAVPKLVTAGFQILMGFLRGISTHISGIVGVVADIITRFLTALGLKLPSIIDSGFKLIISFINGVTKAIDANSEELGKAGGKMAVAIVKGMANGLTGGVKEVAKAAGGLAKGAVNSAKGWLGINSPSKVFHQIGAWSSEGMANGLIAAAPMIDAAAQHVGETAVQGLRRSLTDLSSAVTGDVNVSPVITPVIDLSQFRRDASAIDGMMSASKINASVSLNNASSISLDRQASQTATDTTTDPVAPTVINFEQVNNSPEALSTSEIYRNTQNQLSLAKKLLIPA